jgi:hypothetical protein
LGQKNLEFLNESLRLDENGTLTQIRMKMFGNQRKTLSRVSTCTPTLGVRIHNEFLFLGQGLEE